MLLLFSLLLNFKEQPTDQLDEHRYRIVDVLLAKLDKLSHNCSATTIGTEVTGKPGRAGASPSRII